MSNTEGTSLWGRAKQVINGTPIHAPEEIDQPPAVDREAINQLIKDHSDDELARHATVRHVMTPIVSVYGHRVRAEVQKIPAAEFDQHSPDNYLVRIFYETRGKTAKSQEFQVRTDGQLLNLLGTHLPEITPMRLAATLHQIRSI